MSGSCFITVVESASVVFITLYVVLYPSCIVGFSLAILAIAIAGNPSGETTDISLVVVGCGSLFFLGLHPTNIPHPNATDKSPVIYFFIFIYITPFYIF